jgi:hypothetical protein
MRHASARGRVNSTGDKCTKRRHQTLLLLSPNAAAAVADAGKRRLLLPDCRTRRHGGSATAPLM